MYEVDCALIFARKKLIGLSLTAPPKTAGANFCIALPRLLVAGQGEIICKKEVLTFISHERDISQTISFNINKTDAEALRLILHDSFLIRIPFIDEPKRIGFKIVPLWVRDQGTKTPLRRLLPQQEQLAA